MTRFPSLPHVDDILVADLDPGTFVAVKAAPGGHTVHGDSRDERLAVQVEPGQRYYFRTELAMGVWKGHGKLEQADRQIGGEQFRDLALALPSATWERGAKAGQRRAAAKHAPR